MSKIPGLANFKTIEIELVIIGQFIEILKSFPIPDEFQPERFLKLRQSESDPYTLNEELRHFTYGFGRRVCAGQHVANRSVYINVRDYFDLTFW